jgi:RraA family protein
MNIGCRIVEDFERPAKELVELFREFPVANIDDCMNRMAAIHQDIRPMNSAKLLGPAFTVKVPEGDNLMFHKAMDMAKEGDVIVIDAGGITSRAIFGELMLTYCKRRGVAGVIVDGSIRDKDTISKMDIPVYARGITPNGPYKNGPGEINTVISFGGQVVRPGDLIIGDEDGVIVVKPEEAVELAKKVQAVSDKEMEIMDKILNEGTYIRPWVDEKLAEIGCEYLPR